MNRMSESESEDFAVEFYYRMRNSISNKRSRESKKREDKLKRANSQPFDRGRDPVSAGSTVEALVKAFAWDTPLAEATLFSHWESIVGDQNALNSTPEILNRGMLTVRCKSTAWATQLRLMQAQILEKINQKFPELEITSLKFIGPDAPSWKKGPRSVPGRGPRDTYG